MQSFVKLIALAAGAALAGPAWADLDQEIYHIQLKLNAIGYDTGKPDGVAGRKTREAIGAAAGQFGFAPTPEGLIEYFTTEALKARVALEPGPEMDAVKAGVGNHLKDPFSAEYKDVYRLPSGKVCGLVNGKNAFGAYAGWTPFMTLPMNMSWGYSPGIAVLDGETGMAFYHCMLDL